MSKITKALTIHVTAEPSVFSRTGNMSEDFQDDLISLLHRDDVTVALVDVDDVAKYTLHVGMLATQYAKADRRVWVTDGDGWNSWGDDPGIAGNDDVTIHVMWHEPVTDVLADAIVQENRQHLRPMAGKRYSVGVITVTSDGKIWSERQDHEWYENPTIV